MPSPVAEIGAVLTAYVPDDDEQIALGYTGVRFYTAASEAGSYSLADTETLVAGQKDYSYNFTTALATDWFYWVLYGATPGEGVASEPMPVGPPRSTRKQIRQGVGRRLRMMDDYLLASCPDNTSAVISELIDPDRSPYTIASKIARVVGGTATGQTRRVRSGTTGFTASSGTLTINRSTSPGWAPGDEVELWQVHGDDDLSVLVEEAMQDARRSLWWEDTFYFTTDDSVSDYFMPASLFSQAQVKRVEWAADSYPSRPGWRTVGYWDLVQDGGQSRLTVLSHGLGQNTYESGRVLRVVYNRFGDRMDSETDYWMVPLEWAIAETALELLKRLGGPRGGREDVSDARSGIPSIQDDQAMYRAIYMPSASAKVQTAR